MNSGNKIILQVVRGERPWIDLELIGITIKFGINERVVENPAGIVAVAHAKDIALGLLTYQGSPPSLQQWAQVLLAGVPFLSLELGDDQVGDVLLNALWDASFGEPVNEDAFRLAERLVRPL